MSVSDLPFIVVVIAYWNICIYVYSLYNIYIGRNVTKSSEPNTGKWCVCVCMHVCVSK